MFTIGLQKHSEHKVAAGDRTPGCWCHHKYASVPFQNFEDCMSWDARLDITYHKKNNSNIDCTHLSPYNSFNAQCCSFLATFKSSQAVMTVSLTPSGQPADVGDDSERRRGPDGLRSAPHSDGRLGGHWLGPDSKHTAVEVSLRSSQLSGPARDEATGGTNYTLCCSAPDCDEVENWCPPPSRTSLQNMKLVSLSIFFLFPLSVSLSLYCVSESGVIQDHSLAVSAYHMVFLDHSFYFPFLEKK